MRLVGVFPDGRMPDGLFIVPAIYRAVFTALENPESGPLWYAASIPASAIPCIWLGARLGSRG